MKKSKWTIYKLLLIVFSVLLISSVFSYFKNSKALSTSVDILSHIETINSNIQRVSKLELEDSQDDYLIAYIDGLVLELSSTVVNIDFSDNEQLEQIIETLIYDWHEFKQVITDYREKNSREILFGASEYIYNNSIINVSVISSYISEHSAYVNSLYIYMLVFTICLALTLVKILINISNELKINKELSKDMFIDTSTGLYNRSKCQEILKNPVVQKYKKERAVIVCDLNGLKKTNDEYGHRAGDQLISCFATELKNATSVLPFEIFVGRYGGDEFIVILENVTEREVNIYIEEVNFLMNKFNEEQNKPFKLSCAMGYSITTNETKSLTLRELFDIADENMYKNKIAMKQKQKEEFDARGIEISELTKVDDRL